METNLLVIMNLLLAAALSGIIGFERQARREVAGLRTHMLVCIGSTLITSVSIYGFGADPARIAAGIVTGIGFLGAGAIIAHKGRIRGLTTAASIWMASGIGIAVGANMYIPAIITSVLCLLILELWRFEVDVGLRSANARF